MNRWTQRLAPAVFLLTIACPNDRNQGHFTVSAGPPAGCSLPLHVKTQLFGPRTAYLELVPEGGRPYAPHSVPAGPGERGRGRRNPGQGRGAAS